MRFPGFFESVACAAPSGDRDPPPSDDGPVGGADPAPAPWFVDAPTVSDDARVTRIEVLESGLDSAGPSSSLDGVDWGESGHGQRGTDAVAYYVPWHRSPPRWGIYFLERPFFALVRDIARDAGEHASVLAPSVLRQVLFHELTHFRFEVVGSELENVLGRPLYLDYLRCRFAAPAGGLSGPVEETIATWREIRFARGKLQRAFRPKPPDYLRAAEAAADGAPPGYRDWREASSDRRREELVATVAGLVANRPIVTGGWGNWLTEENLRSVPRRWVGDPSHLPNVKALEKQAPQVTIRVFEEWLRAQGITPLPGRGKGSHRRFEHRGRSEGYGTSEKRLYRKDAKRLARFFGYRTMPDFLIAVSRGSLVSP